MDADEKRFEGLWAKPGPTQLARPGELGPQITIALVPGTQLKDGRGLGEPLLIARGEK